MQSSVFFALLLMTAPGERVLVDRIAAVVNDDVITLSEVKEAAKAFAKGNESPERQKLLHKDILEQLINERLLTQQIAEAKIEVTEDEVERAMKDILRQNKISQAQLEEAIRSRGMSMGQYLEDLKSQLIRLKLVDMKVRSRVVIPESDIKTEFESRTRGQAKEEMLTIRHVFFRWGENPAAEEKARVLARAQEARAKVEGGTSFADVAKEVSEGPTAAQGGSLGELSRKGLLPELDRALISVKPGQMTPPVETSNGVHVVLLEDRIFKDPVSYSQMRDKIYQELYQQRVEEQMKIWLDELRGTSAVAIRLK